MGSVWPRDDGMKTVGEFRFARRQSLRLVLARMPVAEREPRGKRGRQRKHYTGRRDQKQSGEKPRDVELQSGDQNLIGEPGNGSSGARDEFRNDGADQRQARRDPQAREEIRQRAGHAQAREGLPAAGAVETK